MIPILLVADIVIWYNIARLKKQDSLREKLTDKTQGSPGDVAPLQSPGIFSYPDKDEDRLIIQNFEMWLETQRERDLTLEEYLWSEGIINPELVVWADGTPLEPGFEKDLATFKDIKHKAQLEGIYNSKLLTEGGEYELKRDELLLKGVSLERVDQLLELGVDPESIKQYA